MAKTSTPSADELFIEQDEEARADALRRAPKGQTATGQAQDHDSGDEDERVENLPSRGSTHEAGQDEVEPDIFREEANLSAAQEAPARMVPNGTVPQNHVATPSGPMPVSAATSDPARAKQLLEEQRNAEVSALKTRSRSSGEALTNRKIDSMGASELRAVASDRGYDVPDNLNTRAARARFKAQQAQDPALEGYDPEDQDKAREQLSGTAGTSAETPATANISGGKNATQDRSQESPKAKSEAKKESSGSKKSK